MQNYKRRSALELIKDATSALDIKASKKKQLDRRKNVEKGAQRRRLRFLLVRSEDLRFRAIGERSEKRIVVDSFASIGLSVKTASRGQKLAAVMIRAAVASDASKSLLIFIEEGVKLSTQVYLKMLKNVCCTRSLNHSKNSRIH